MDRRARGRLGAGIILFVVAVVGTAIARGTVVPGGAVVRRPLDLEIRKADLFNPGKVRFVKVLTADGSREVKSAADLRTLAPDALLAVRLKSGAVRVEDGRHRVVLPYRFRLAGETDGDAVRLRAVVIVEAGGLRMDPSSKRFVGSVLIGIEDERNPDAPRRDFPTPIPFQFVFSGGAVAPGDLGIRHTNLPFQRVGLDAAEPPSPALLSVMASFDTRGEDVEIPVTKPRVELRAPDALPGLGFGFGTVSVRIPPHLVGHVKEVTLHASQGRLDPSRVSFDESGSGQSRLRSSGLGEATVEILAGELGADPVTVTFGWPWHLLIAIVVGALVGGGLYSRGGGRGGFLAGLLAGLVTGAALCGGVNLTGADLGNYVTEVLTAVAAALPGFRVLLPGE